MAERLAPIEERLKDEDGATDVQEHTERYEYAATFVRSGDYVLDAACGTGYGSEILSRKAKEVVGIDYSPEAIAYDEKRYGSPSRKFYVAKLGHPLGMLKDASFDMVVSLETLEHVLEQDMVLREFKRVLRPGGRLILSTPNREVMSRYGNSNPYHLKELSKNELTELFDRYFTIESIQGQGEGFGIPLWKRSIKHLKKIPFLAKIKQGVVKNAGYEKRLHRSLTHLKSKPIHKWQANSIYFIVSAVRK